VVLGYSQLNYEFYRDARDTFRKVALDSGAMNKALMGIGLAAAYQKDFAGAANAFRILAEKVPSDLSVDEAFLLLPVALVEAGDGVAAAVAYQQAIRHYENKIHELEALQERLKVSDFDVSLQTIRELDNRAQEIYGGQQGIPGFLLNNYQNLLALRDASTEHGLAAQFNALHGDYKKLLQGITHTNIDSRLGMLNSYLSQAKFGMAQLYDKP
jgi:tetratricopeptide (TPR) repeat protein